MIAPILLRCLAIAGAVAAAIALQPADPLAPPANGPRRTTTDWSALTDATVHVSPTQTIEHATVVVKDGRIVAVLAAPVEPPAGAARFDASGLHIYAGLIDAFVEVEAPMPDLTAPGAHWNKRVTPQRSALDGNGVDARTSKQLRELGFTAAAISPRTGNFRGSGAVISLAEAPADASASRPPVYKDRAFNAVSLDTSRGGRESSDRWESYPDSQMGAIALLRQTLSDADWLGAGRGALAGKGKADAAAAHRAGVEAPNCLETLIRSDRADAESAPLLFDVDDELEVLRAGKIAREFNRPLLVVGSGMEFRRLDAIKTDDPALIVPLAFPEAPKVDSIGAAEEVNLRDLMTWEQAPTNPRRLAAAGLTVALTTSKSGPSGGGGGRRGGGPPAPGAPAGDAPGAGGGGGGGGGNRGKFMDNLRKAIRHGLAEDAALAMLTTNPAKMLGVGDRLGTVETGKIANLVVADGPLFAKKTKLREVWIDGRRHELSTKPGPFEGTWDIALEPGPANPGAISWVIKKGGDISVVKKPVEEAQPAAPAAEKPEPAPPPPPEGKANEPQPKDAPHKDAKPKEIKAKARAVRLDDAAGGPGRISFIFDHDAFGGPGVFTITGLLDPTDAVAASKPGAVMRGDGTRADGARFRWTATRTAQPTDEKNATPEKEDKDAKDEKAGDEADDKPVTDVPDKLGLPFGAYALDALPEQYDTIVISGATIWTQGPDGTLDKGAIVIRKGKIDRVYAKDPGNLIPAGPVPPGWLIVDAKGRGGKHISPGIIDCHSHTGISKGVNEAGQAVTAEVRIEDVTNPDAIGWYRELAGGVTTVNNLHGSANPIGGQNCVNKIRWGVTRPDDMHLSGAISGIKFALGENVKQSNSSDTSSRYPKTRMGVEAIIRDRFTAAREYAAQWRTATEPRSHEGTKHGLRENDDGDDSNVPRLDRLAEGDGAGTVGIQGDGGDAGGRTIRSDDADAASSGLGAIEHRRGPWSPEHSGLSEVPANRPRFARRVGDTTGTGYQSGDDPSGSADGRDSAGNRPRSPGSHPVDPSPTVALATTPPPLRGSVAPWLRGSPPFRRDLELETLAQIIDGKRLIHCHSYRQDEILMLCRLAHEFGFKIGTFQHNLEGYKVADEVAKSAIGASLFSDWWAYKVEVQDAIPAAGPIMHDAGVTVSYNSDSDELARRMNVEAGKAVKYGGLAPHEALKFVTINPAKQLMLDKQIGSLEVGKDADFVIWSGPPTSSLTRCEATYIDGREYYSLAKDAELRARDAKERQRIIQKILAEGGKKKGPRTGDDAGKRPDADKPDSPGDTPPADFADDSPRSGRDSLMAQMLQRAADRRRDLFFDLYRRGIDPESARCGDCGESMLLEGASR